MASTNHIVEAYMERASQADTPLTPPSLPKSSTPAAFISQPGVGEQSRVNPTSFELARNRGVAKRKISTFNLMLLLVGTAVVIVLYISDIIAVGQLMNEINLLRQREERLLTDQEILRAHVNRLAGSERIRAAAEGQLGLKVPTESPVWIQIDQDPVSELEQQLEQIRAVRLSAVNQPPAAVAEKSK